MSTSAPAAVPDKGAKESQFERDEDGIARPKANRYQFQPDLDVAAFAALKDSISANGVLYAGKQDQHGHVLDGHQRLRACTELGVDCPMETVEVHGEAHAWEIAQTANLERRHMPPEQLRDVIRTLVEKGHSSRAISKATGVSQSTAAREARKVATESPDSVGDNVISLDGRKRPRQTSARKPKSVTPAELRALAASEAVLTFADALVTIETAYKALTFAAIDAAVKGAKDDEVIDWRNRLVVLDNYRGRGLRAGRSGCREPQAGEGGEVVNDLRVTPASEVEMRPLDPLHVRALTAIQAVKAISHTCPDSELARLDPDGTLCAAITTLREIRHTSQPERAA